MATPFPEYRFIECNVPPATIATLRAAWDLLSGPVQDAEAAYLAGVDNRTIVALTSFPVSGGGYPAPQPPSGQLIVVQEGAALAIGSAVTGASADGQLGTDSSGNLAMVFLSKAAIVATGLAAADIGADASGAASAAQAAAIAASAQGLAPTAVKASAYTAAAGDFVPVDASGGTVAIALPSAPADRTRIGVKIIAQAAPPNAVTINRGGSDVFNKAAGSTSLSLAALFQGALLQYASASGIWYVTALESPLGTASGAAKLGTDNTVGGPGGSGLTSSVVTDSSATPKSVDSTGVSNSQVLAYDNVSGKFKPTPISVTSAVALGNRSTDYALSLASSQDIILTATLTGSWILTFTSAPVVGQTITMRFTQDGTGGRVVTLPAAVYPAGAFALNSSANTDTVITYIYDGSNWQATKVQAAAITVPQNLWRPSGSIAETFPRNGRSGVNEAALLTGRMSLSGGMVIPANTPVSHLTFVAGATGGSGLTHMWAVLLSQDRSTILKLTNDDTSATWTASTAKTFDLASTYTPSVDTPVVVGLVVVGTVPTILGTEYGVNSVLLAGLEPIMCANVNAAGLTNPASFTAGGAVTASGTGLYAYAT